MGRNTPWKKQAEVGGSPCVLHELGTLARSLEEAIMYWRSLRLSTGGLQKAEGDDASERTAGERALATAW
ncbi:unnamed protein product [Sphagnum jensenii]|uniref:Uncharacterized protein n=1 Tax=Sphagnum jensenii TaxID=128206 RepID=A0ABP1AU23_9BRYO